MSNSLMRKVIESRNLPPGHYGRLEVAKEIEREYKEVFEFEKKIPYVHLTDREAAATCALITKRLGLRKITKLVLNSKEADGAVAIYRSREIHYRYDHITLATLLHEISHHVKYEGNFSGPPHGSGFLEAFNLVLEALKG